MTRHPPSFPFFFFNDTATTEIYTLSLHDALPISDGADKTCLSSSVLRGSKEVVQSVGDDLAELLSSKVGPDVVFDVTIPGRQDRKSTRLNSSHDQISYAVFCLKKKKMTICFMSTD